MKSRAAAKHKRGNLLNIKCQVIFENSPHLDLDLVLDLEDLGYGSSVILYFLNIIKECCF